MQDIHAALFPELWTSDAIRYCVQPTFWSQQFGSFGPYSQACRPVPFLKTPKKKKSPPQHFKVFFLWGMLSCAILIHWKQYKKKCGRVAGKGDCKVCCVLLFYNRWWISLFHLNTQMLEDPKLDGKRNSFTLKYVLGLIQCCITGGAVA